MPRRVTLDSTTENEDDDGRTLRFSNSKSKRRSTPKTPATPAPVTSPPLTPFHDWEQEYKILREAYQKQQRRLEKLQDENDLLKQQLKKNTIKTDGIIHEYSAEEPPQISSTSMPCSPGTKFVSELVEVMDLNVGQHAVLANIMDRHYKDDTALKEQRRCSM